LKPKRTYKPRKAKAAEEESSEPAEVLAEGPRVAPTDNDNRDVNATSPEAIAIGKTLGQPFSNTDLRARLDGDSGRDYRWIATWKAKDWIETCGFGAYRRTRTFGNP
jgi:hypothetical protein